MPPQELRDYQARGEAGILEAFRRGARKVLAVLPPGGGKTTLFAHLISQLVAGGLPSLINVHRRELATQAANRLLEFGVPFGFIMAGEPRKPYAPVQIASVQTLIRRQAPSARLVVNDEAQLSTAGTWQKILALYPNARILGVTATPWRLSGRPLADAYDEVVVIATPRELCAQGYLAPYVGFSYKTPDLSKIKTLGGEYNEQQSAAAMSDGLIVDNVVEEWGKHARDLSTIVFAVTVEHSKQLTERFKAAGVSADHLDGQTPRLQREAILKQVERGRTTVLCNVGIAVEGLDIPRLKCCVLARPTKSLARAIQMMGRVRRPWEGITARIHDHAFNIKLHGLPDQDRDYSLNAKPEIPPAIKTCEECQALYTELRCPACNHENREIPSGERVLNTIDDAEQYGFASGEEDASPLPAMRNERPIEIVWNAQRAGRAFEGRLIRRWDEPTNWGTLKKYFLSGSKRNYILPGTTHLNALMAGVAEQALIQVTYMGAQHIPGGKRRHLFKVAVDDET